MGALGTSAQRFGRVPTLGLPSWSWSRCLPYFERMETFADSPSDWRGSTGQLKVFRSLRQVGFR